jgi:alanine racemase
MSAAPPDFSRPNRFEIDLAAIAHNTSEVRRMVGASTEIFAALKANGYGFGVLEVAESVLAGGADGIAVVDLGDAIEMRRHSITAPILLYAGHLPTREVARACADHDLMPTIVDEPSAAAYADAGWPIRVWVKVDAGAGRLGVPVEDAVPLIRVVSKSPTLTLHGVYTHLHMPGGKDEDAYAVWQFRRFEAVLSALTEEGIHVPLRMAASTSPLLSSCDMKLNAVDPGQLLYGLGATTPASPVPDLRPAFRALKSRLIQVKRFRRTEFPDLAPLPLREGMRVGVIPIGLVDGMRLLSCGQVVVRGCRAPLGPLNVEHTRVDLTDVPDAQVGDEVVIIGRQGDEEIRPQEVIERNGIKLAELAPAVRDTVPKIYLR